MGCFINTKGAFYTMGKLDRDLQRNILNELCNAYPMQINVNNISSEVFSHPNFAANVKYLSEHGFVNVGYYDEYDISDLIITAEGIDFCEDDGGISAILKTVTVKPDVNSFLELLIQHAQTLPPPEKENWISALATFSSPVVQNMFQSVLSKALGLS